MAGQMSHFRCCECHREFANGNALEQHRRDKTHRPIRDKRIAQACCQCNRRFLTQAALEQHERSLAHHPISNLKCIDALCQQKFKSPSSMLHHLESGACRSGMNREDINSIVSTYDTERIISSQPAVDAFGDDHREICDSGFDSTAIHTPNSITLSTEALQSSREIPSMQVASQLESPVATLSSSCRECSKVFKSVQSLDKHQSSAAHAMRVFQCPISLLHGNHGSASTRSFTTLSGLAQHVEAKACVGGIAMLRDAASYLESRFQQVGWTIKLLIDDDIEHVPAK
ncbi:zinc finger protein [Penicillium frequentans]|uniref:Zinc finger protein n=1 Tax=Penicillium frequentans TaxID=3151616 RepID=A0AAD6G9I2_9EURO|nr:zinc finger protein [Penicillium glabrum]